MNSLVAAFVNGGRVINKQSGQRSVPWKKKKNNIMMIHYEQAFNTWTKDEAKIKP